MEIFVESCQYFSSDLAKSIARGYVINDRVIDSRESNFLQNPRPRSSRLMFYLLIVFALLIALFVSILIGLIMLIAVVAYYTWRTRFMRTPPPSDTPPPEESADEFPPPSSDS